MRKKGYGVRDNTEDPKLAPSKGVAKNDKLLRYVQSEHKKGNLNCFVEHLEPKVSRDTSANGETNEWVMQMMEDEASHDMGCAARAVMLMVEPRVNINLEKGEARRQDGDTWSVRRDEEGTSTDAVKASMVDTVLIMIQGDAVSSKVTISDDESFATREQKCSVGQARRERQKARNQAKHQHIKILQAKRWSAER
ncbi:hypothetical protein GN958_ATG23333 [Phytophthora infestans]|uniref:Uncharacterized protein n=1 Tax=Phytophthora infestans TaxID=4787 RepID=A0A8S9TN99_PHYIN|nr:hypothetical protein GN958_ATG23333 [Phytophthora infestans]